MIRPDRIQRELPDSQETPEAQGIPPRLDLYLVNHAHVKVSTSKSSRRSPPTCCKVKFCHEHHVALAGATSQKGDVFAQTTSSNITNTNSSMILHIAPTPSS